MNEAEPDRKAVDARIAAERLQLAMRGRSIGIAPPLITLAVIGALLWPLYPPALLLAWLAAGVVLSLFNYRQIRQFQEAPPDAEDVARWTRDFAASAVPHGLLWGAAVLMFGLADSAVYLLVANLLATAAVFGALWLVSVPRAFMIFALLVFVPLVVSVVLHGTLLYIALGAGMLTVLLGVVKTGRSLDRMILETLRLRYEKNAALAAAEASSREKSRFLATASHDLRQPLQAVTMYASALEREVRGTRGRHVLGRLQHALGALTGLFDALLDISRLDSGQVPMAPEAVALAPLFESLREEFEPLAAARGLRLRVRPTTMAAISDPHQLRRIIGNLLANAISYTEAGTVWLGARRAGERVRIEVRDTGGGIPADQHDAVFREFYQVGNPERDRRKGLGLGLAIVRRVARQLGHGVVLRSAPGRGSTFGITLERTVAEAVTGPPEKEPGNGEQARGRVVLIVDDEIEVREATAALLESWKCQVWLADGLDTALAIAGAQPRGPDLILCDYRLRGTENGIDVISALRRQWGSGVPAAVFSGDSDKNITLLARGAGLPLLRKPVRPAALRSLLNSAIRRAATAA